MGARGPKKGSMLNAPRNKSGQFSSNKALPTWVEAFLAVYRETLNVKRACDVAGINRYSVQYLRDSNVEFETMFHSATEDAVDVLHGEIWRRGIEGVVQPVFHAGEAISTITVYSDTLAKFLYQVHRPGAGMMPQRAIAVKAQESSVVTPTGGVEVTRSLQMILTEETVAGALTALAEAGVSLDDLAEQYRISQGAESSIPTELYPTQPDA